MKFIQSCSVEEVLSKHKLPGAKFYDSLAESYRLYTTGLSVQQIARKRHLAYATIFCHLCRCIKLGKPVKLADLTVTKSIRNTIINVIRSSLINSEMSRLSPIKDVCPKIITLDQIRVVTTFLQVCDHLDQLNCEYEDFKNAMINGDAMEEPESDGEGEKMIKELDSLVDELIMDGTFLSKTEVKVTDNSCEQFILVNNFDNHDLNKSQDSFGKRTPDKCKSLKEQGFYDFTEDSHIFLAALGVMEGEYSVSTCIGFLRGSKSNSKLCDKHRSHELFGSGKHKSYKWWKCIGHILQREGYLESHIKDKESFLSTQFCLSAKGERFLRNMTERPNSTKVLFKPSREMLMLSKRKVPLVSDFVQPLTSSSVNIKSSNLLQKDNDTDTENMFGNQTKRQKRMSCDLTLSPSLLQKDKTTKTQNLIENEAKRQKKMHFFDPTSPNLLQKDQNTNTQNLIENETKRQKKMCFYVPTPSPNLGKRQKDKNTSTECLTENETRRGNIMSFYNLMPSPNLLRGDNNNTNTEHLIENETRRQERMHFYNPTPSLNLLQGNNNANIENETRKQDRMHFCNLTLSPNAQQKENIEKQEIIHRLLLMKRTEIVSRLERMPYMIASTEALMKMTRLKPCNIDALKKCQGEGFTANEIMKFGEEFIKIIPFTPSPSVEEVLSKNPLIKLTAFATECHRLYTTGLPIQQIANQKHLAFSIILSHLCDCIKAGKPVNLADLTVTKNARKTIVRVIRSPFINSDMTALTAIKNRCPENITYNQIRAVVAFLQVCDHLDKFRCKYEDFKNAMIKPKYSAAAK